MLSSLSSVSLNISIQCLPPTSAVVSPPMTREESSQRVVSTTLWTTRHRVTVPTEDARMETVSIFSWCAAGEKDVQTTAPPPPHSDSLPSGDRTLHSNNNSSNRAGTIFCTAPASFASQGKDKQLPSNALNEREPGCLNLPNVPQSGCATPACTDALYPSMSPLERLPETTEGTGLRAMVCEPSSAPIHTHSFVDSLESCLRIMTRRSLMEQDLRHFTSVPTDYEGAHIPDMLYTFEFDDGSAGHQSHQCTLERYHFCDPSTARITHHYGNPVYSSYGRVIAISRFTDACASRATSIFPMDVSFRHPLVNIEDSETAMFCTVGGKFYFHLLTEQEFHEAEECIRQGDHPPHNKMYICLFVISYLAHEEPMFFGLTEGECKVAQVAAHCVTPVGQHFSTFAVGHSIKRPRNPSPECQRARRLGLRKTPSPSLSRIQSLLDEIERANASETAIPKRDAHNIMQQCHASVKLTRPQNSRTNHTVPNDDDNTEQIMDNLLRDIIPENWADVSRQVNIHGATCTSAMDADDATSMATSFNSEENDMQDDASCGCRKVVKWIQTKWNKVKRTWKRKTSSRIVPVVHRQI